MIRASEFYQRRSPARCREPKIGRFGAQLSCPSPRGGVSWIGTPPHTRQEHHSTKDAPLSKRRARKPDSASPLPARLLASGDCNRRRRREHNNVLYSYRKIDLGLPSGSSGLCACQQGNHEPGGETGTSQVGQLQKPAARSTPSTTHFHLG